METMLDESYDSPDALAESFENNVDNLLVSKEYHDYIDAKQEYDDAESVIERLDGVEVLDRDLVTDIESRFPGVVYDNIPFDKRYTPEGITYARESLEEIKHKAISVSARSTMVMINSFHDFIRKVRRSDVTNGVAGALDKLGKMTSGIEMTPIDDNDKLVKEYQKLMGVAPESPEQVKEMIKALTDAENATHALKEFPNSAYDGIFTPLLAATIAKSSPIFDCFDKLNNQYASTLLNGILDAQSELGDIMEKRDYKRLSRYSKKLIPDDVHKVLSDVVSTLGVKLDHKKPVLQQTKGISKQMTAGLKPNESSLRKKATVVNNLNYRFKELDKAYSDVLSATDKISKFDKGEDDTLKNMKEDLTSFKWSRSPKEIVKGIADGTGKQAVQQYRRIIDEIDDVWNLIGLFTRMSIVYTTAYTSLKLTLDIYIKKLDNFLKVCIAKKETKATDGEVDDTDNTPAASVDKVDTDEDESETEDDDKTI